MARPVLGEEEWCEVRDAIESGWVAQGPRVAAFEGAVADYCGARFAVAVSSCTAALHLSLVCAGVGPGDEVIVPSLSFIATANAVVHAGAVPVFAEVRPETMNLDPAEVATRLGGRVKAIILVHQLGLPAELDAFRELAEEHALCLIEDAACALGSRYRGEPIGASGEFVCLSFHPRKLVTTGEGGMVLTDSPEHAARLRRLRQHGMTVSDLDRHMSSAVVREAYGEVGFNYRLSDLAAAVGIAQLRRLDANIAARTRLARSYDAALRHDPRVLLPTEPPDVEWNVQTYAVRIDGATADQRDALAQLLLDAGIPTRPGVMTAHRERAYARNGCHLPISEQLSDTSLALPLHPGLSSHDCEEIAAELLDRLEKVL